MGKFTSDSEKLLQLVGGKENISAVSHCVTRMRFVLVDNDKADIGAIEKLSSVKGTFTQAGQFQVIIGNEVSTFYNDFTAVAGIEGVSKDAVKQAAKQNQNIIQRIMTNLAEIFAPLIPAIIVGGLILGFRNVIGEIKMFDDGTKTLVDISQFWSGMYSFLWLLGEAIFHFLPVGIVWSITKKMGTTQILGIVLGITLVSPQLLNAYAVAGTAAADIPKWDFGFFTVDMIGYQAQVIPAILAGFTLVYLEKFFRKISPAVISMIVVPFVLTYAIGKKKGTDKMFTAEAEKEALENAVESIEVQKGNLTIDKELVACVSGKVIPITEVEDMVFSQKVLGDGIAFIPESDVLVAPCDGTITTVMQDSFHACGMNTDSGLEILFHIGLDTIDMNGDGFKAFVTEGDRVKAGDKLIAFDRDKIKAAGHPDVTMMVVTDAGENEVSLKSGMQAISGQTVVATI